MFYKCQVFFGRSSVRLITRMDAPGDPLTIVWFAFENQVCCFRWYTVNTSISSKQNWIHLASKIELMFYHNQVCCFRWYTVYFITLYFVGYYLQCVKDSRPCKTETEAFIGRGVWSGTLPFADNSYLNHWWWTIYKHYLCSCTRAGEQSEHVNFSFWLLFKETMSKQNNLTCKTFSLAPTEIGYEICSALRSSIVPISCSDLKFQCSTGWLCLLAQCDYV